MKIKRTLCMLLALMMVFSIAFPTTIFADDLFDEIVLEDEDYTAYEEPIEDVIGFDEEPYVTDADLFEEETVASEEAIPEYLDERIEAAPDVVERADEVIVEESDSEQNDLAVVAADEELVQPEDTGELVLVESAAFASGSLTIVTQPKDVSAKLNDTVEISIEAAGEGTLTYEWWFKEKSDKKFTKSTFTGNPYSVPMTENKDGRQVYCVVKNDKGESLKSDTVTITLSTIVSGDFVFKKIDGTNNLALIEYTGNASSITVPGSVDGMIVTEIGLSPLPEGEKGVFEGNTTLISVELPNSITAIREKAFKGCTNLSSMTTY